MLDDEEKILSRRLNINDHGESFVNIRMNICAFP